MAKSVIIDELHLTVRTPAVLPEIAVEAVRQILIGEEFLRRLRKAIHAVARAYPELAAVRLSLTR
jgi:hypothetical protein